MSLKQSGEEQHKKAVHLQLKQMILLSPEKDTALQTPIVRLNSFKQIKIPLLGGTVEGI